MNLKEPYQMDLFDLEDKSYQPVFWKVDPRAISTTYFCPKCRDYVGSYIQDDGWAMKKDECRNGHRMNWEHIKDE